MGGRATPSKTGGGWEGESKEELSPSCESVPDPQLNDSILDPDMCRRLRAGT